MIRVILALFSISALVVGCTAEPKQKGRPLSTWLYDLTSSEEHKRGQACEALALFGPAAEPGIENMIKLLDDGNEGVQAFCSDALAAIGQPAVAALEETLKEPAPHVRMHAAFALLRIDSEHAQAGKILAQAATAVGNTEVAREGQDAILKLKKKAVPLLLPFLDDPYLPVQLEVVKIIGKLEQHGAAAVEPLTKKAQKARSDIRVEAIKSLARVGEKETLEPIFRSFLEDEDEDVANHAGAMLQYIGVRQSASGNEVPEGESDQAKEAPKKKKSKKKKSKK